MSGNLLPVPFIGLIDVTNAVLFLVNDSARYLTGAALPVDADLGTM
jgi:NAD(P)-dependent dehydrogenase (short-subunit alcohol dehydrogenase family)